MQMYVDIDTCIHIIHNIKSSIYYWSPDTISSSFNLVGCQFLRLDMNKPQYVQLKWKMCCQVSHTWFSCGIITMCIAWGWTMLDTGRTKKQDLFWGYTDPWFFWKMLEVGRSRSSLRRLAAAKKAAACCNFETSKVCKFIAVPEMLVLGVLPTTVQLSPYGIWRYHHKPCFSNY